MKYIIFYVLFVFSAVHAADVATYVTDSIPVKSSDSDISSASAPSSVALPPALLDHLSKTLKNDGSTSGMDLDTLKSMLPAVMKILENPETRKSLNITPEKLESLQKLLPSLSTPGNTDLSGLLQSSGGMDLSLIQNLLKNMDLSQMQSLLSGMDFSQIQKIMQGFSGSIPAIAAPSTETDGSEGSGVSDDSLNSLLKSLPDAAEIQKIFDELNSEN